ncbi:MAG TPA: hypothetical protein VJK51_03405 [Candidatus Nanoarchaeia archaeon]|nr:hypothetical protein [Candidatus Nanoarchaeia archaeon]
MSKTEKYGLKISRDPEGKISISYYGKRNISAGDRVMLRFEPIDPVAEMIRPSVMEIIKTVPGFISLEVKIKGAS